MDFGDILTKWDAIQRGSKHKTKAQPIKPHSGDINRKKTNAPEVSRAHKSSARSTAPQAVPDASTAPCSVFTTSSPSAQSPVTAATSGVRALQYEWIHKHITFDKDAVAEEEAEREAQRSVRHIKQMKPDARLDLHGYTQDEAWRRLSDFIDECMRRGARKALIIHGKGIHTALKAGVLSNVVQDFIERDSRCGASGHPDRREGGRGATWVMLKR